MPKSKKLHNKCRKDFALIKLYIKRFVCRTHHSQLQTLPGTDWGNEEMEGRVPAESMKDTVVERSSRLLVDCGLSVRTPGKEKRGVALMPVKTPQKFGTGTP